MTAEAATGRLMAWRMKPGTNDVQIVLRGEAGAFARVLREVATGSAAFTNALDSQHPWSRSLAMLGRDFRETLEKDFPAAFDWVGEKPDWWCRCQGTARRGDGAGGFSPNSEVGKAVRQGQRGGARRLRRLPGPRGLGGANTREYGRAEAASRPRAQFATKPEFGLKPLCANLPVLTDLGDWRPEASA